MNLQKLKLSNTGVNLYESKHKRGSSISGHYHDHFQILYALDGEGEMNLDGKNYNFCKDQMVLIVPNSIHSIHATSPLTVLVLAFSQDAFGTLLNNGLLQALQDGSLFYDLNMARASEVRQLLRKMLFEQTSYDSLCILALPVYLSELLLILVRLQTEEVSYDLNDMRAIQIRDYLDRNYFETITAESLSLKFELTPRYINTIFKTKFHETPLQYLQKIRINRAKMMLIETDLEIVSICFEIGYETLSPFYRSFRNLVGVSPHKFRTINQ
ncbi:hypothetical protein WQ54_19875 [Bacillus sp. SA1-12]|uniref:AraC family transcriptional regulator n=1 Tax=Bacillus sp. SA1-12 TaxID=1455638 RepID=UPI000626ED37|nr:AraC family transcriptional regulator [Bacillus sp. SA1-12]KKI90240.1 hypothetical protein WQ54_19875 [Bacillus sp. SA1-12]